MKFLHTNDLHGMLVEQKLPYLLSCRAQADLYFDTGDCIRTGNLGIPLRREPVWTHLSEARCNASVIGNRETHVLESAFRSKLAGATHPVLCGNLRDRAGHRPLPATLTTVWQGVTIGVLGVSVAMVTERMRTQAASAFLWDDPVQTAVTLAEELRPSVDVLIALTHIGHSQDRRLAERCPLIDMIFGGHSHTVLESPEKVGGTWICQGGSHARFLGLYEWDGVTLTGGLRPWSEA